MNKAIAAEPDYPFSYIDRARANRTLNHKEEALADLDKAITLDNEYYYSYFDRGRLLLSMGKRDRALQDFNTAIKLDPNNFVAYIFRAGILEEKGLKAESTRDYEKVISLKPEYYFAYDSLAILYYVQDRFLDSSKMFAKAAGYEKENFSDILLAAVTLKKAGKEKQAKEYLKSNLKNMPSGSWQYHIARYYLEPSAESSVLALANDEKIPRVRAQMLFYLAVNFLLQNKKHSAVTFLQEVVDTDAWGYPERRLARYELDKFSAK
jgi:tetratricopeptide (TPR) repeat protein